MNIGFQLQPGDNGIPDDGVRPEAESLGDEAERWLAELSYHAAGKPVLDVARKIVWDSYAQGKRFRRL